MKRINDEVFEEVKKRIESSLYDYPKYEDALFYGFKRLGDSETYKRYFHNSDHVMVVDTSDLDYSNPEFDRTIERARIQDAYFKWGEERLAVFDPFLSLICRDLDYDYRQILPFMAKQYLKDNYHSPFKVTYFLLILKVVCHHSVIYGCGDVTYINEDYKETWEV